MDESALTRLAKRTSVEQALHDSGCLVGLAFGIVGCWIALLMLPLGSSHAATFFRITAAVAGFVLAPMAGKHLFQWLGNLRGQRYRAELARRYGQFPWKVQVQLTQQSLSNDETAILLRQAGVTNSGTNATTPGMTTELRFSRLWGELVCIQGDEFDFGRGLDPREHFQVFTRALTTVEVAQLNDVWQQAVGAKPQHAAPADELISEKTLLSVIPVTGKLRTWAAHDPAAVIMKAGAGPWRDLLSVAVRMMDRNAGG